MHKDNDESDDDNMITVGTNFWCVPTVEKTFSNWLEGAPTDAEKMMAIAQTEAARSVWKPSAEALQLVEKLKTLIGYKVQIQFWHACMFALEEEGPYPLNAMCRGVVVLQDGDFPQAFLELSDCAEQPNVDGYSPASYLQKRGESAFDLAPLSTLYTVKKL